MTYAELQTQIAQLEAKIGFGERAYIEGLGRVSNAVATQTQRDVHAMKIELGKLENQRKHWNDGKPAGAKR